MKLNVTGGTAVEVADAAFAAPYNETLVHQAVTAFLRRCAGGDQGAEVTVRRAGRRAQALAPEGHRAGPGGNDSKPPVARRRRDVRGAPAQLRPEAQSQDVPRGGFVPYSSELVRRERLTVVASFSMDAPKTRDLIAKLEELALDDVLIVTEEEDENLALASRNLGRVGTVPAGRIDPGESSSPLPGCSSRSPLCGTSRRGCNEPGAPHANPARSGGLGEEHPGSPTPTGRPSSRW